MTTTNQETLDWYRDGDQWVAMDSPLNGYVQIGVGDTREEAAANLEETPIACTGRDYRFRALRWAYSTVEWISDTVIDPDDGEGLFC